MNVLQMSIMITLIGKSYHNVKKFLVLEMIEILDIRSDSE